MSNPLIRFLKANRSLLLFLLLMAVFRSAVADWNTVPTASMRPTIVEGDRILVNKLAYDVQVPFSGHSLVRLAEPERGDIVVFDSHRAGKRLVKRVVGLPGDVIAMRKDRLWINGNALPYSSPRPGDGAILLQESLRSETHSIRLESLGDTRYGWFGPLEIPPDHFLVLGDNRHNSADSRVIGLVPRAEIIGRARHVVMSLDYDHYYLPRPERFFHRL